MTVTLAFLAAVLLSAATAEQHLSVRSNDAAAGVITLQPGQRFNAHVQYKSDFTGLKLSLCPEGSATGNDGELTCIGLAFLGAARDGSLNHNVCTLCNERAECEACDSVNPDFTDSFREGELVLSLERRNATLVVALYQPDFGKSQVLTVAADASQTVLRLLPFSNVDESADLEVKFTKHSTFTDVRCYSKVVRPVFTSALAAPRKCWADTPVSIHFLADFFRCLAQTVKTAYRRAMDAAEFCA